MNVEEPGNATPASVLTVESCLPAWIRGALAIIIAAGLLLRVILPDVTVFCEDQAHACALAEDIADGHWETGGLINSGGFRNLPGFAYLLAAVWSVVPSPTALLQFVGVVNVIALLFSAYLIRHWFGTSSAWWSAAFLASAPWAIHYSRWIWAQHLLFPAAILVYWFLGRWLSKGKRWSVCGLILALTVLVQIHLIGVILVGAIGILVLWIRPRLPARPLTVGVAFASVTVLPYLLAGHLDSPNRQRFGYEHFWRVIPGAAMSVSGLHWQLEFRDGYPEFARFMGWRRFPYQAIMVVPVLMLTAGVIIGLRRTRQACRASGTSARQDPGCWIPALVVVIPILFAATGLRTSPTYFPMWYPLPFALMGLAASTMLRFLRHAATQSLSSFVLIAAMFVQLAFFAEQLIYVHRSGGVPGSLIGRSYAGMKDDMDAVPSLLTGREIWMVYEGPSVIQDEPAAYLLRHLPMPRDAAGRQLLYWRWWSKPGDISSSTRLLEEDESPPAEAWLIRPWTGPQQYKSEIPRHR